MRFDSKVALEIVFGCTNTLFFFVYFRSFHPALKRNLPLFSVTRLGNFWKFRATSYPTKVAQMYGDFWAILKNITCLVCTQQSHCIFKDSMMVIYVIAVDSFWAIFGKVWGRFYFNIWSHCHCSKRTKNFFKWANTGLFFIYLRLLKHTFQILQQIGMWKNVHPVYGAGIWTHDLWNMSLLP